MKRELELEVICGTYEEFVVGYKLYSYYGEEQVRRQFEQSFADHSHTASVRTVASGGGRLGHLLASGGADEIVKLYDLQRRTEIGQLMYHTGTITCAQFHGGHHLLTGSEDGRLAVVRTDNWQCERRLGRHVGGLSALAVHPSGRLALTAGRDHKLVTWDLLRGRLAFRTHLKAAAEFVVWSPGGATYAVGVHGRCDVYSVQTAGVLHQLKLGAKINCAAYLSDGVLACGDAAGRAALFSVGSGRGAGWQAHETRVRAAAATRRSEDTGWLVTAASDGWIKVWQTQVSGEVCEEPQLVASYNTTCRLTCVTLHVPSERRWAPPAAAADTDSELLAGEAAQSADDQNGHDSGGDGEDGRGAGVEAPGPAVKRKTPTAGDWVGDPVKRKKKKKKVQHSGLVGQVKKSGIVNPKVSPANKMAEASKRKRNVRPAVLKKKKNKIKTCVKSV